MIERALNIRLAVVFLAAAALMLVCSGFFFYAAATTNKSASTQVLAAQCIKDFEAWGFKTTIRAQDQALVSQQPIAAEVGERVSASSVAIGRCAGYRLVEFCAGNGCSKPGVFFVLESL